MIDGVFELGADEIKAVTGGLRAIAERAQAAQQLAAAPQQLAAKKLQNNGISLFVREIVVDLETLFKDFSSGSSTFFAA